MQNQAAYAKGLDENINHFIAPVSDKISSFIFYSISVNGVNVPIVVFWLLLGSVIFTIYMGFVNIRCFKHAIELVRGDYENPDGKGEISHFQALATALSGTVGLGNIAGVAVAISLGGPGATFWMIIGGLLGMSTKFTECTLGVKYRSIGPLGKVHGGPMHYLSKGLAERGFEKPGKILAALFAILCIGGSFGGGNMFQINQATRQFIFITGGENSFFYDKSWLFGLIIAVLLGMIIIGGIKQIAKVTEKIVPFMCVFYVLAALVVIFTNYTEIPNAFALIIKGAFSPEAIGGGILGVMIQGFKRATFSNEAGIGSSSIAHSAVKTDEPVTEGIVALLEPFIDTVIICTITALVIIITGTYNNSGVMGGVELTSEAFANVISWFPYVLSVGVILFAFSTAIAWSYYGVQSFAYLFGKSKPIKLAYNLIFCVFVVIGASMNLESVVNFSDAMIFAMAFVNIIGLYILAPVVKSELNTYLEKVKSGEIVKWKKLAFEQEPDMVNAANE